MKHELLTIRQLARFYDTTPKRISYAVQKAEITPHTKRGGIRLFTWQQVKTIRQALARVRPRKSKVKRLMKTDKINFKDSTVVWFSVMEREAGRGNFEEAAEAKRELERLGVFVRFKGYTIQLKMKTDKINFEDSMVAWFMAMESKAGRGDFEEAVRAKRELERLGVFVRFKSTIQRQYKKAEQALKKQEQTANNLLRERWQ